MPAKVRSRAQAAEVAGSADEDASMQDAPPSYQPGAQSEREDDEMQSHGEQPDEDEEDEPQRIRVLPGSTETAASFEMLEEGHTLGNALRYIIMKNPDVEFCAYAIPHPSEAKMNLRIQTYEGTTAIEALQKGLMDLQDLCDVVATEFWTARQEFSGNGEA